METQNEPSGPKVWFITGASRGLGRVWAEAALERGDRVAATSRKAEDVADLAERFGDAVLPLELDVTNGDQVALAVTRAHGHFGRLDVVLNNAGYSLVGMVEEAEVEAVRAQFETNFFGTLRVIQAALPLLRQQRSGHILGVSSAVGLVAHPFIGLYGASKFAVEALLDSLAQEVKAFGIQVTILEPGAYSTEFGSPRSAKVSPAIEAYAAQREQIFAGLKALNRGNPRATARAILQIVDAKDPPLRFAVGSEVLPGTRTAYAQRLATWAGWEELSNSAQG